jgi:hypothetical protein
MVSTNEMEILTSHSLAQQAVRDLKLYTNYYQVGKVKDILLYGNQPISVDLDPAHLEKLNAPISLEIERLNNGYHVTGTYYVPLDENRADGPYTIDKQLTTLPATIGIKAGILSFATNEVTPMAEGTKLKVFIQSPKNASYKYVGALSVSQTARQPPLPSWYSAMRVLSAFYRLSQAAGHLLQPSGQRRQERDCRAHEEFINGRLEKINAELGATEGALENYKKRNKMVELKMNAGQAVANADAYSQKLTEANTQVALLDEMQSYMNNPSNKYSPSLERRTDRPVGHVAHQQL